MDDFTTLERAVLEAICAARPQDGAALRRLLATARVLGRDNTGHGFYTSFRVSPDLPPLRTEARGIGGPLAWMESMGDGNAMGFVLWFEDGRPDGLEGFQHGDTGGATVDLRQRDLSGLTVSRLEPPDDAGSTGRGED